MRLHRIGIASVFLLMAAVVAGCSDANRTGASRDPLADGSDGDDWPGYGRTYGEQHYSPLTAIDAGNVARLGLAWSYDLPPGNPVSVPIEVGGTLFTATGHSVVRAFEATTGKLLWTFDPKASEASGKKLRQGYGSRGLAWGGGLLYVATHDGRLIALAPNTGREIWSALTVGKDDLRFITGAPRYFDGKVIIGHGGADSGNVRGYVTAYDARTGKQLWRFWTVPGNPAEGFENDAMRMAAKTWTGDWWKFGGGGTAWNAFSFDPDTDTIFVGTGNGSPWNQKVRSPGGGDNLFLCSIIALDARTGAYKWHYQFNPGETWDYNASMDMQFADLMIDGKLRKVVMESPKNGFFYVLDRVTGQLLSADFIAKVTWADRIDLKTGRPVERPAARFPNGSTFQLSPPNAGAHTWMPSAYSSETKLVYFPIANIGATQTYSDEGIDLKGWRRKGDAQYDNAIKLGEAPRTVAPSSELLAWDPVAKRAVWRIATRGKWNGGVLATGGNLVFQGQVTGLLNAYDARTGKSLWSFNAQAPVVAPPISYRVGGRQFVTVIAGAGTSAGVESHVGIPIDYREQKRRVLTFELGGKGQLPQSAPTRIVVAADSGYRADPVGSARGLAAFIRCAVCHGPGAIGGGTAPDLRTSGAVMSSEAFTSIVRDGALVPNGMPQFGELSDAELEDLRQYIREQAQSLRGSGKAEIDSRQ